MTLHGYDESARLLMAALSSMSQDVTATAAERFAVLMDLVDACRWIPLWPELVAATEEAIALAEQMGDVELVAGAATAPTVGALWQSAPQGEVNGTIVRALRWCLERLEDGATRSRVMLSLANETYFVSDYDERRRLVDGAMAIAQRLGDDRLSLDAYQVAFQALWCSRTGTERLGWSTRAIPSPSDSTCPASAPSASHCGWLVLANLELPWQAMAGRFDVCAELIAEIDQAGSQMSLDAAADARSDADPGTRVLARLAPYAGRNCSAGSGNARPGGCLPRPRRAGDGRCPGSDPARRPGRRPDGGVVHTAGRAVAGRSAQDLWLLILSAR